MIRLDKYLCDLGIGTRTEVKKHIKNGLVSVNDEVVNLAEYKVDEASDTVSYCGKKLCYAKFHYYMLHKPGDCVTANSDRTHKTVMEYLPSDLRRNLSAVGRLDLDTEGLLILTDDGALNHHLVSPSHHVDKTYLAYLDCPVPKDSYSLFETGIDIGDDKLTEPAVLEILEENAEYQGKPVYPAKLTIHEGRFHQVKRMFEKVGCQVVYLKRLTVGPLSLGDLPMGSYRKLTEEEVSALKG